MHATDLLSVPQLAWGIDAQILAAAIVIIAYAILFTEKINRAVIALLAASVMIFSGILTQSEALKGIDFNTLALLIGMMTIVGISEKSGMFQYVAVWGAKKSAPILAGCWSSWPPLRLSSRHFLTTLQLFC